MLFHVCFVDGVRLLLFFEIGSPRCVSLVNMRRIVHGLRLPMMRFVCLVPLQVLCTTLYNCVWVS